MKKSNLTFAEGFLGTQAKKATGSPIKTFDWESARGSLYYSDARNSPSIVFWRHSNDLYS